MRLAVKIQNILPQFNGTVLIYLLYHKRIYISLALSIKTYQLKLIEVLYVLIYVYMIKLILVSLTSNITAMNASQYLCHSALICLMAYFNSSPL